MTTEADLSVADRLARVLDHLGIERAHFVASMLADVASFAQASPERIASLTLVCPPRLDPSALRALGARLQIIAGDQGRPAAMVRDAVTTLPEATVVWLLDISVRLGRMLLPTVLQMWRPLSSISSPETNRRRTERRTAAFRVRLQVLPTTVKAKARPSCCYH